MKILVTGGAGFIGSNLTDALIKNRHRVVIVDNLSAGSKNNLNPEAKFIKADIKNSKKIEEIFKKEKPEAVFHMAAQIDVRKSVENPMKDAKTNILAGINLANLAVRYKVRKFIFSSTGGAIYGDTEKRPTLENHSEWPLSPYGIAKLTLDKYLFFCQKQFGLKSVSLRYGNVYGPRQNSKGEAGVVAIFIGKMLKGENPIINGKGKQTRDYVFVSDVVRANLLALRKTAKTGIFNIGTGEETSVNEIFKLINQEFQNKFTKKHGPAKPGEQKTSCLDWQKAKKELGWSPKIKIQEGIRKTFNWFAEKER